MADHPRVPAFERPGVQRLLVAGVVVVALALRVYGLTWGLPDQRRLLSYHPDEGPNLVGGVLDARGAPRPHLSLALYNYGGLYFYLWQGAAAANQTYGLVALPPTGEPDRPSPVSPAALILVGRLVAVLCGTLAAWATYALGRRLYGAAAGLGGALVWAVAPGAVVHGHYATVDVPATLFVLLALVFAARSLTAAPGRGVCRELLASGALCGLAAATKYNCAVAALAPLAAALMAARDARARLWLAGAVAAVVPAAFAVGNPGAVIDWARFVHDFTFELTKSGRGAGLLFAETGNGWVYHVAVSLRFAMTAPLVALGLAGVGLALRRRERGDVLMLLFVVAYFAVIGAAQVRFLRYVLPLIPLLGLLAARLVFAPWPRTAARAAVRVALGVSVAAALGASAAMNALFSAQDARDRALDYIVATARPGQIIAFGTTPWYYTPPFAPGLTLLAPAQRRQAAAQTAPYVLRLPAEGTEWDLGVLQPPPDLVVLSDIESADALRVGHPPALEFARALEAGYRRREFVNYASVLGVRLPRPDWMPNDWLYPWPRVTVFSREAAP